MYPASALRQHTLFLPAANLTVRAAGLAVRLGLVLYLTRFLGIDEVGQFGLIQGAAGLTPIVLGWGVTYFLGREIIGASPLEAGRLVRDRLLLTVASLTAGGTVVAGAVLSGVIAAPGSALWIAAILFLEALAFDLHFVLISLGRPLAANFLLFVRSGLWVVPAAGLGLLFPALRTLDFVLLCWLLALVVNFAVLSRLVRDWPLAEIARSPVDAGWVAGRMRRGGLIYLNDLGIAGMIFLDRYIVHAVLDLRATGIFVLHWAIANAVHVLVTAATVQVSLPLLVEAYRRGGEPAWRIVLRGVEIRTFSTAIPLSLAVFLIARYVLPLVVGTGSPIDGALLGWMLVATVIRLMADVLNYGLYSRGLDQTLAWINIGGVLATIGLSLMLLHGLGITGVGVSMALTSMLLLVTRAQALASAGRHG